MPEITHAIMWIFIVIFTVLAGICLLDIAGIHKISDPDQRKWLFRSLIGTVVVAVGSFGASQFHGDKGGVPTPVVSASSSPDPVPHESPTTLATAPIAAPSSGTPTPAPADTPDTPPALAELGACKTSPDVRDWASTNLGAPPVIDASFERDYPKCVATIAALRSDAAEGGAADDCVAELNQYHQRVILPYYERQKSYGEALRTQEAKLRKGVISAADLPTYNYILCQNRDLNYASGSGMKRVSAAEERIRQDMLACERGDCRAR